MKRTGTLLAIAVAVVIAVLLGVLAMSFMSLSSANDELDRCRQQQRQTSLAIMALHMQDMQAAKSWWTSTHQAEFRQLQDAGIAVVADYIDTRHYTAVIDPANPYTINIGPAGNAEPGEVIIGLGHYFVDNMTKASGWSASYRLNATTREVAGFTASLAQQIAHDNYVSSLSKNIYVKLGVSAGSVLGSYPVTLDTSYLPETGTWLDVTEYRYSFRNTDKPAYLTVRTYINGSTGEVKGAEVSHPYYTTASTIIH